MAEKKIEVYQVDDSVPIPVRRKEPVPLSKLKVGESILFPIEDRPRIQQNASRLKRGGKEFTVKAVEDNKGRVWRTK